MKFAILLLHAFAGWALCGAIMGIGPTMATMDTTLIIHAIGAPIIFSFVTVAYTMRSTFATPLQISLVFVGFVILMDVFVVALLIEKSFEMFASFVGTWLPFVLIFLSSFLTAYFRKRVTL